MLANHRILTSSAELEAYLHRTRMAILDALRPGPATASQVAAVLGVHPANLTRHFRILEAAGLIELVEKRDTGRNLEKYYATTASSFEVAPGTHEVAAPHRIALAFARSDISAALGSLPATETRPVAAYVAGARLAPRDIERFGRALSELIESFTSGGTDDDGEAYHLVACLYPGAVDAGDRQRITLGQDGAKR